MTTINKYLNNNYAATIINKRSEHHNGIGVRATYDLVIKNLKTNGIATIEDFKSSPLIRTERDIINDFMSFAIEMACEWKDFNRRDEDDEYNTFETVYNTISPIMTDKDMEDISLYFYDLEASQNQEQE